MPFVIAAAPALLFVDPSLRSATFLWQSASL